MTTRRRTRPAVLAALGGVLVLAGVAGVAGCTPGATADGKPSGAPGSPGAPSGSVPAPAPPRATYPATVTVNADGPPAGQLSDGYVGLSFESGRLSSGRFAATGNLPQLLKNLGPAVIRFGGNSVDQGFSGISPADLRTLNGLAAASGWSVLYSEDLGHFDAAAVTRDAAAVSAALGPRLAAFACGNEPDLYQANGLRPRPYTEGRYLTEVTNCFDAIRAGAPDTPLEGPDLSGSPGWLVPYAAAEKGSITWLGQHDYPLGCRQDAKTPAELATALLSAALNQKEVATFDAVAAAAKIAGAQARVTETSSDCSPSPDGLSYSYATALWAVDYLLTGAEHGISGMNFHGGLVDGCDYFTPLCRVSEGEYSAQPIYYGMLFAHLLGTGRLLPVTVSSGAPGAPGMRITAFALRPDAGGTRVLVENMSPYRAATTLRFGSGGSGSGGRTVATMLTMTGPSPLATSGVRIQGAEVAADGRLAPGPPTPVACGPGTCPVTLAPYSAALLTLGLTLG